MNSLKLRLAGIFLCVAALPLFGITAAQTISGESETPTLTPTATPQGTQMILTITDGGDDVNESSGTFDATQNNLWIGNGGATTDQYLGLRFTDVAIPPGSVIHSAHLEIYSDSDQWIRLAYDWAAEATADSQPFSADDPPSKRKLTEAIVSHESDIQWLADTWYPLDDISAVVQAVIDQPDWQMGSSLTLIAQGVESGGSFGRKFFSAFEDDPALAARLVIDVTLGVVVSPAVAQFPTLTPTPSATPNPCAGVTLPARLAINRQGRVVAAATAPVNVRQLPGITASRRARLEPLVTFTVIGGPVCADGVRWFQIRFGEDNKEGWLAEGQGDTYFVEPLN